MENSVRQAGWHLDTKPFTPKEIDSVMGCFLTAKAWPCVSKTVSERGIDRVAAVTLSLREAPDGARQLVISERLVLASAVSIVAGQRFCLHCTDDTLGTLAGELTKELIDRAALRSGRTVLAVSSTPQRATYSVDGIPIGITDAMLDIAPGTHVVMIERDGYETATRTVEAEEGKTTEVAVTLVRPAPAGQESSQKPTTGADVTTGQQPRRTPVILLASGAAGIAIGGVLFAFNQTSTTAPRGQEQPRGYYSTVPFAVGFIAAGTVAAGFGGYLWWRYSHTNTVAPVVAPSTGGAVIGVRAVF